MEKNTTSRIESVESNALAQRFYHIQEVTAKKTFEEPLRDANGHILCDEDGVVKTRSAQMYNANLRFRLRRTNPSPAERAKGVAEEDLIIVENRVKNHKTGFETLDPNPFWPANNATEVDIKALWPDYAPDMSRDALNALPAVAIRDAYIRIGVYAETDAAGQVVVDENGEPVVTIAEKWISATLSDGSEFELQGGKRQFNR